MNLYNSSIHTQTSLISKICSKVTKANGEYLRKIDNKDTSTAPGFFIVDFGQEHVL